jgi:hypothetical protein
VREVEASLDATPQEISPFCCYLPCPWGGDTGLVGASELPLVVARLASLLQENVSMPSGEQAHRGAHRHLLLKGHFRETAKFAAVQLAPACVTQQFNGTNANAQVLIHPLSVKVIRHAWQFDFPMQGLVAHA